MRRQQLKSLVEPMAQAQTVYAHLTDMNESTRCVCVCVSALCLHKQIKVK